MLSTSFNNLYAKFHRFMPVLPQKKLIFWITVILTTFNTVSIGYIIYQNWTLLINYHWHFDLHFLALSFLFYSINLFIVAFGWVLLLRRFALKGAFFKHFRIFVLSEISKRVPGKFWYLAGRMLMYQQQGAPKTEIAVASGIETVLMMNGALIGYLLSSSLAYNAHYLSLPLMVGAGLSLILIHPRFMNWILRKLKRREVTIELAYHQVLGWLILYTGGWLCGGTMLYWWLQAMAPVPLAQLPGIIAIWTFTGVLSNLLWFLPGTLGVRELALTVLINQYVAMPTALIAAVLLRILLLGYQLIFALLVNLFIPVEHNGGLS